MTMDISHLELPIEEVVPGSAGDPFTAKNSVVSPQPSASPAVVDGGTKAVPTGDGSKDPAQNANATPTQEPDKGAPQRTLAQLLTEDPEAKSVLDGLVKDATGAALRTQQGSYDRQINSLKEELKAAKETAMKAEREAKLNSEDLTDDEKDILRNKYALEDRQVALDNYEAELDVMYKEMVVAELVQSHSQFGVTREALLGFDDPDEMEAFAKDKELEAYRSGVLTSKGNQVPDRTVQSPSAAQPEPEIPAGARAPSDVGGGAPAAPATQLSQEAGLDALASNLKKLTWETVRFN